jgi:hypothetical protein
VKRKKLLSIIFFNCLLPLLIGFSIYLLFRPNLFPSISFFYRKQGLKAGNFFLRLLVNNGPDFCWYYSFASALLIVNFIFFKSKLFTYLTVMLIVSSEMVQIFLPRHFTFDWIDVGAAMVAVTLSYLTLKNRFV